MGIGSNAGHRARHIHAALRLLQQLDTDRLRLHATSLLYESTPVGSPPEHARQPRFLNGALELHTSLPPLQLLEALKSVESRMGRDATMVRNGPRCIDLDLLMYESAEFTFTHERLQLPHPRWAQRGFVIVPLMDLLEDAAAGDAQADRSWRALASDAFAAWQATQASCRRALSEARLRGASASLIEAAEQRVEVIHRVIPFPTADCVPDSDCAAISDVFRWGGQIGVATDSDADAESSAASLASDSYPRRLASPTLLMGILNLTPDSFSDGGTHLAGGLASAIAAAKRLWDEGADVIDIGGESTRPGSVALSAAEELSRILPVIDAICAAYPLIKLSVDTYHPSVAREALRHGCVMLNDVYGGTYRDPHTGESMLQVAAECNVPYVCMHMRGNAQTMTNTQHSTYEDVVKEVRDEQQKQIYAALSTRVVTAADATSVASPPSPSASPPSRSAAASTPASSSLSRWNLLLDPGIGFAKGGAQAVQLLRHLPSVYPSNSARFPVLVGTSRKGFIANALRQGQARVYERHAAGSASSTPASDAAAPVSLLSRDWGTSATVTASIAGGASIVRVHDVAAMRCVRDVADQLFKR